MLIFSSSYRELSWPWSCAWLIGLSVRTIGDAELRLSWREAEGLLRSLRSRGVAGLKPGGAGRA